MHAIIPLQVRPWRPGTSGQVTPPLTGSIRMGPPSTSPPQVARRAPRARMSSLCQERGGHLTCRAIPQPDPQITTNTLPTHTSSHSHSPAHNPLPTQAVHHVAPSRPQSPPQPQPQPTPPYTPTPPPDPSSPWHTPITQIPTAFSFVHDPWMDMEAFVLLPDGGLPDHLHLNPYPTVKTLQPRQKNLLSHAVTLTIEEVVRSEGVAKCRWLSILHLLPRLLLLTSIHTRHQTTPPASNMISTNTPPPNPPFRPSSSRDPLGGRRVGAPRDIAGDAFEARVRAFLQGRFWELLRPSLDVTLAPIRAHEHPETP